MAPSAVNTNDGHAQGQAPFVDFYNVIDGRLATSKTTHHGVDPVTERDLWEVPTATRDQVDEAVAAGATAFRSWRQRPWSERKECLIAFTHQLAGYKEQFAELLIRETGKPRFLAEAEFSILIDTILHFTELSLPTETTVSDEQYVTTSYVPLGVCVAIGPWNFPIALFSQKFAAALLCGNTIILKPSPFTPYSTLKLAELAQRVFPPAVFQALSGDDRLGPWLAEHAGVAKIAFTGSAATGKKILQAAAPTVKRVTLELGGNDAVIICDDVDPDHVAAQLALGLFLNTGQVCVAPKRVYIHDAIFGALRDALVRHTSQLKVGATPDAMVGPIQNKAQFDRVRQYYDEVTARGFHVVTPPTDLPSTGYFLPLTLVEKPDEDSRLVREEQFGPIVPLLAWTDEADVIARANDTPTGLSASVWSRSLARARRIGDQLEVGGVYINGIHKPSPMGIFGGHKESGLGCEFRTQGLLMYCNPRSTFVTV